MNPLQDLIDIRTPSAIESWPPAYGWWLLAGLVVLCMFLLAIWRVKTRKVSLAKRHALKALQQIDGSSLGSISQLNQLLKRVVITYFPDQNIQQMYGAKWTDFLVKTLPEKKAKGFCESFESMQRSLYQQDTSENSEFPSYCKSVETWIKYALPPRKHVLTQLEQNNA
jgi:hypothetical protein